MPTIQAELPSPLPRKLTVLAAIARALNNQQVTWALGASAMLYMRGIVRHFHDIDIIVLEEHATQAVAALLALASAREVTVQEDTPSPRFATRHYHQFAIEGVSVDLLAGFVIISSDGQHHECPLSTDDIDSIATIGDAIVPLHSLSTWQRYYELMGRKQKAQLCQSD